MHFKKNVRNMLRIYAKHNVKLFKLYSNLFLHRMIMCRIPALPLKSHMGMCRLQDPPFHTDF